MKGCFLYYTQGLSGLRREGGLGWGRSRGSANSLFYFSMDTWGRPTLWTVSYLWPRVNLQICLRKVLKLSPVINPTLTLNNTSVSTPVSCLAQQRQTNSFFKMTEFRHLMTIWELHPDMWTCPINTMEAQSQRVRHDESISRPLTSCHSKSPCCGARSKQSLCNLILVQHQTTTTNKATNDEVKGQKNSRKGGRNTMLL